MGRLLHRQRILGIATAMALLLAAAGCSGAGEDESGGTSLSMWTFKQTHVKALEAAAAEFKAKTGITVTVTAYTPDDTYASKVQSAAQTKDVADVLEVHAGGEDFTFGGAGILTDLAPVVNADFKARFLTGTADTGLVTDKVYQKALNPKSTYQGVKQGQLFSVPFTAGTFGIVYASKSKLQAAGIDPSKPPATWEDLVAWITKTRAADPAGGGITLGLKVASTGLDWALEPLAYGYLGKAKYEALFGKDRATSWGSPSGQQALELYHQITPLWAPGSQTLGIDDADRAFAQGKAAFDIGGTFTMAALQQNGMKLDDLLAFGLPAAKDGAITDLKLAPVALTGLAISAQTKHQSAALQWLDFLTGKEQAGAFAKASLDLPGTDLGAEASSLLGPNLSALEAAFGTGEHAFNPIDTTFMGPSWDIEQAGSIVVKLSPLNELTPAAANTALGDYTAGTWK